MSSNDSIELNNLCPESETVTEFLSDTQNRDQLSFFLIVEKTQVSSTKETPCMVWQNEADTVTSICHGAISPSFMGSSEQCQGLSPSLEHRQQVRRTFSCLLLQISHDAYEGKRLGEG